MNLNSRAGKMLLTALGKNNNYEYVSEYCTSNVSLSCQSSPCPSISQSILGLLDDETYDREFGQNSELNTKEVSI